MTAIRDGRYGYCPIPEPGARTVDVAHVYNVDRYRPITREQDRAAGHALAAARLTLRAAGRRPRGRQPDEGACRGDGALAARQAPASA